MCVEAVVNDVHVIIHYTKESLKAEIQPRGIVLKPSNYSYERVRNWIKEREHGRANGIFYLAQGIFNEMGEEEGTKLVIEQIRKMGYKIGESMKNKLETKGLKNSLENRIKLIESSSNSTNIAWDREYLDAKGNELVVKFSYCPIADGFKMNGEEGVKIGELFCSNIDDSVSKGYNPNLSCVRETSLNKDGVCTLHFTMRK